jgi:hypothetical protein
MDEKNDGVREQPTERACQRQLPSYTIASDSIYLEFLRAELALCTPTIMMYCSVSIANDVDWQQSKKDRGSGCLPWRQIQIQILFMVFPAMWKFCGCQKIFGCYE